jgi:hypothetical protein
MRRDLRFILLPEGTSDRALMPILEWTLYQHFPVDRWTIGGEVVQTERLPPGRVTGLVNRIRTAVDVYGCNILFVHRDEDGQTITHRQTEVEQAVHEAGLLSGVYPIAVIPVRMTEAWLLIDELAIRRAAGFAAGRVPLNLPAIHEIERRADPKTILRDAIKVASGQSGRKLASLRFTEIRAAITDHLSDLNLLRALPSFRHFESAVAMTARELQSRT